MPAKVGDDGHLALLEAAEGRVNVLPELGVPVHLGQLVLRARQGRRCVTGPNELMPVLWPSEGGRQ